MMSSNELTRGWIARQPIRTSQKQQLTVSRLDRALTSTQAESADREATLELTASMRWVNVHPVMFYVGLRSLWNVHVDQQRVRASEPPPAVNEVTLLHSPAGLNLYVEGEIHPPKSKKGHHVHSWDLFDRAEEPAKERSHDVEDGCPHEDTLSQANRTCTSVGTR